MKRTDGRYMVRYTLDGKRCAIYGATFEEVRVQLTETLANIERGVHIPHSNYTLSQWLRAWLITYALPTVKRSTYIPCENCIRLHFEPARVFVANRHYAVRYQQIGKWKRKPLYQNSSQIGRGFGHKAEDHIRADQRISNRL